MRLLVTTILGFALIGLAFMGFKRISQKKKNVPPPIKKVIPGVFTQVVKNETKPIHISSNGTLVAKEKIELFSEVQGIFEQSEHNFKPGVYYRKGELLLQLNSDEFRASLQIQKSNLYQKLISVLPDLRLDYPAQFDKWNRYISNFEVDQYIKPLPRFDTNQEKLFISGRGIQSAYYMVKNQQERLAKYNIYAPYNGILTRANVTKGTLIRPGMKIGTFIRPNIYELELSINNKQSHFIKKGKKVKLQSLDHTRSWTGTVSRINTLVDPKTQSVTVFIDVSGKGLKEGMYLEAEVTAQQETEAYEVNRSLLGENNTIFIVKNDSVLTAIQVDPIHFMEKTVLVKGLENGMNYVKNQVLGAYDGKIVKVIEGK